MRESNKPRRPAGAVEMSAGEFSEKNRDALHAALRDAAAIPRRANQTRGGDGE